LIKRNYIKVIQEGGQEKCAAANDELDLVRSLKGQGYYVPPRGAIRMPVEEPWEVRGRPYDVYEPDGHLLDGTRWCKSTSSDSSLKLYRLAFDDLGLLCFCPINAKIGDIVREFPNSDVLFVLRMTASTNAVSNASYVPVGRAVDFLAPGPGQLLRWPANKNSQVNNILNLVALQFLPGTQQLAALKERLTKDHFLD